MVKGMDYYRDLKYLSSRTIVGKIETVGVIFRKYIKTPVLDNRRVYFRKR